jgi:hypothetical protein
MHVSDVIYGRTGRYVSARTLALHARLRTPPQPGSAGLARGDKTAFFAFADTVSARNYQGTNECHGWMGVKFQAYPRGQDNQIIIHVRMLDEENTLQQEALGIIGVNLLYAAFSLGHNVELQRFFRESLFAGEAVIKRPFWAHPRRPESLLRRWLQSPWHGYAEVRPEEDDPVCVEFPFCG